MSKAKVRRITIRHGRTRRIRSLTRERKVSNLLTLGINRSSHPKLRVSQLELPKKILNIHNIIEDHFSVGNVEDPTCVEIVHLRMRVQGQLIMFKTLEEFWGLKWAS